jgi:hypothetical protein
MAVSHSDTHDVLQEREIRGVPNLSLFGAEWSAVVAADRKLTSAVCGG